MENKSIVTKVNDRICAVEKTLTWIVFSIMLALLVIQVICRYCFDWPLAWAEELVRYTYIGVSFLGAAVAVRENSHICIDILPNVIRAAIKNEITAAKVQAFIDIFACIVGLVFWTILTVWMVTYNIDIEVKKQITTSNEWPMWVMCLPVSISCIMMGIHSFLNGIEKVIEIKRLGKEGAGL